MTDRFRIPLVWARSFAEHKLSVPALLRYAGLPEAFFEQEKTYATTAELFGLWRAVGELSPDASIGLKMGADFRVERQGPAAFVALCSASFRHAVERVARYKQLTCPQEVHVHTARNEAAVEFFYIEADQIQPDALVDLGLSWILSIARRGTDGRLTPLRLELTRAVRNRKALETHFGCRVEFRSKRNALVFRRSDLDQPFTTHNVELLAALGGHLETEFRERNSKLDLRMKVKQGLQRYLAGKRPTLQTFAPVLGMSPRTLQRRLCSAGFTFQQVVEETRSELALHFLNRSTVELNEVAFLLGYGDANSFFRAFQRWHGTSPGEWRKRQEKA